jgi:hypothetical protein
MRSWRVWAVVRSVTTRGSPHSLGWRHLAALLGVFLITRVAMAFFAGIPSLYTGTGPPITADVYLYRQWGLEIVTSGRMPYSQVPIEYPPGLLPFIILPAWLLHHLSLPFLPSFVLLMGMVDAVGLIGLWRLARRWGSPIGAWVWVVGLPLLGPVALLRLDVVPAVATIWCLERAAAGKWTAAGAFLGFGALAKLYPAFLLPAAIIIAPQRRRLAGGAVAVVLLGIAPLVLTAPGMATSVVAYHAERGIQIESLWGNALLLAGWLDYDVTVRHRFGSDEIIAGVVPTLETLSKVISFGVVGFVAWVAWRSRWKGNPVYLASTAFTTLAVLLITGHVCHRSTSYGLWPWRRLRRHTPSTVERSSSSLAPPR